MKPRILLISIALLLAAAGGILSYDGYVQSQELLSTIQSFTVTSQQTITNVQSNVVTTTFKDTIVDEEWTGDYHGYEGCGYMFLYNRTLLEGPLHISYDVSKSIYPPITDFYLMRPLTTWPPYVQPPPIQPTWGGCGADIKYAHTIVFSKENTNKFEGTVDVDEAGRYDILLLVQPGSVPSGKVSVTLRIEQVLTTVTTLSETLTSTVGVAYETSTTSFQAAGLSTPYYAGIGLVFVGIVVLLASLLGTIPRGGGRGPLGPQ